MQIIGAKLSMILKNKNFEIWISLFDSQNILNFPKWRTCIPIVRVYIENDVYTSVLPPVFNDLLFWLREQLYELEIHRQTN